MKLRIVFIGAGNLATHLAEALQQNGYPVLMVYSRTEKSASLLAKKLGCRFTARIEEIDTSADLFFVALKDAAVQDVLTQIDFQNKLVVHCSGSLPLSVLKNHSKNRGVLYPLQTFSKKREIDFRTIPLFVEASSEENEKLLLRIAEKISSSIFVYDSAKRKSLHVSAVFACNFVNHFYAIAAQYLNANEIPFEVLKPLILETAKKVQEMEPKEAQTGPAVRFDENIINDHLNELESFPEYKELYNTISKSIFEYHKKL